MDSSHVSTPDCPSWVCWPTPVTLGPRLRRKACHKCETHPGYRVRHCLRKIKQPQTAANGRSPQTDSVLVNGGGDESALIDSHGGGVGAGWGEGGWGRGGEGVCFPTKWASFLPFSSPSHPQAFHLETPSARLSFPGNLLNYTFSALSLRPYYPPPRPVPPLPQHGL